MPLWNRVVAAASARTAGENSFERKPSALQRAIFPDSLNPIRGTGGRVTARAGQMGTHCVFVKADQRKC